MTDNSKHEKWSFSTHKQEVLNFYQQYGYHIEYDVYSDTECAQLIEAAHLLAEKNNMHYRPLMMPHRQDAIFLKSMKHPKVVAILTALVNGEVSGLQTEFFYCKPGTRGFSLHQDNFYVEAEFGVFASAWVALTDTYPSKGGLMIYPGSHHEGRLPVRKLTYDIDLSQDPNANNEETIVPVQYERLSVSVPKGAVLFIHGHLVHGSHANHTNEYRYVLLTTYIKKGCAFRPGKHAKRAEVSLCEMS